MDGVDAEDFERLHLAQRARGAKFHDRGRAGPAEDEERGQQRTQFTDHRRHHDRAEQLIRPNATEDGNGLSDDDEP